ncbi:MAG: hypothetical protein ACTIKR_09485 [Advenella sp.]|uniref:Lipoprotein n=1 Tax=Advenella kashmirensis TaxID=310575 RepID=A0A356LJT3_9BURK|nr:hypothetical protein [Advenella sp. FME57]HBP31237.1 hypothetical protein [Advenella kashmirensis]
MNAISSLLVLCCLILPVTACTPFSGAGINSQTGLSGTRQPKPDPFTASDSSAGSTSPPAPAFTTFGSRPAAWRAVIDGPLLQIELSAVELVTLTAERFNDKRGINVIATDYTVKQQNRRRKNKVNLTINRKPCVNAQGAYDLSAILFYKKRKYTGCAVAGTSGTEH